jgi:hypothetical protein
LLGPAHLGRYFFASCHPPQFFLKNKSVETLLGEVEDMSFDFSHILAIIAIEKSGLKVFLTKNT